MGIRGLKSFIEQNDNFLINNYHLHDCTLIIDANNLISNLLRTSQAKRRADIFGSDLVLFANYLNHFFNNLSKCNIKPILVFDGAQPNDEYRDKADTRLRRCRQSFKNVMNINKFGGGEVVVPSISAMVAKSVACTLGIKIAQAMFEADDEIARLAHVYRGPVLSNDSDFYLFELPEGVISFDMLHYTRLQRSLDEDYSYISCRLYKQSYFVKFFPGLEPKCLPLVGILAGNDFVDPKIFRHVCDKLPRYRLKEQGAFGEAYSFSKTFERIFKILYYLCGSSLNANIDHICRSTPKEKRRGLKQLIQNAMKLYEIPKDDQFLKELTNLVQNQSKFLHTSEVERKLEPNLTCKVESLSRWLKSSTEQSIMMRRALEVLHRNRILIRPFMDDPSLPSSHLCQRKCLEVFLQLTRISSNDERPCEIYDRSRNKYIRFPLFPAKFLNDFGSLDYLIFDIPTLSQDIRRRILFATFNCSPEIYENSLICTMKWFDEENARELSTIKVIFDYINKVSYVKLWKSFRRSALACYIYYTAFTNRDTKFSVKMENPEVAGLIKFIEKCVKRNKFDRAPLLTNRRGYNCRLMHQISQLQTSLYSFNLLNAFLGCPSTLIKFEHWLNSCFIYNFTEHDNKINDKFCVVDDMLLKSA